MSQRTEAVDRNPFSPEAIAEQSTKRFSSPAHRAAMAAQIAAVRRDGYVILENLLDEAKLARIKREFARLHADRPYEETEFGGHATQRVYNLVRRTRELDELFLHPKVLAVVEGHLEDQIQLSISSSVNISPGESAQAYHRDDGYYPLPRPHAPLSMNTMWAIDDFTEDNGATLLLPGTHRSGDPEPPVGIEPVRAAMPAGSVLLWDGSLFHGGGENRSARPRLGVTVIYARAWLRQQENQFVAVPPGEAMELSRPLQKLIGYWVVNNLLGYIDNASPRAYAKKHYR